MVLIMSVEPGFGGQKFIPESLDRIRELRLMAEELNRDVWSEVDGGFWSVNARLLLVAGAKGLVGGASVFKAEDPAAEIHAMLHA